MNITYNNLNSPVDILTFTEVPNILKVTEYIEGTRATFSFTFADDLVSTVTGDAQYYVTFLGETVSNVMTPDKAKNKRFLIGTNGTSTAASFANALRNCGSIYADFNITSNSNTVYLVAKTIGQKWSNMSGYLQRNIPTNYLGCTGTDGAAYSDLFNSRIQVDVYSGTTQAAQNYITTLEKNWYGNDCAFDVSPVLSTFSDYGKTIPYQFRLSAIGQYGSFNVLGNISGNTAIGYRCNQSDEYKYATNLTSALNENRDITRYVYGNTIPFSVIAGSNVNSFSVVAQCLDSAYNNVFTTGRTGTRVSSSYLVDMDITIPQSALTDSYYVDLYVGSNDKIRFEVIKPLKATEYYQRVYWRNEYGGIEFFDFTGARSETDEVNIETYEKNIFDHYDTDAYERKKIYDNKYKKQVTLTSHLMKENGKYVFNSLMNSKKLWTIINGKTYYIIPKSIDVAEDSTYNNIYTARLTYEYSEI